MDITLEDVESAILVLREFMKRQREYQSIVRQLAPTRSASTMFGMPSAEDMIRIAMEEKAKQRTDTEAVKEPQKELTEQDLARMREITEKRKGKGRTA